jgi:hypothetical protein
MRESSAHRGGGDDALSKSGEVDGRRSSGNGQEVMAGERGTSGMVSYEGDRAWEKNSAWQRPTLFMVVDGGGWGGGGGVPYDMRQVEEKEGGGRPGDMGRKGGSNG